MRGQVKGGVSRLHQAQTGDYGNRHIQHGMSWVNKLRFILVEVRHAGLDPAITGCEPRNDVSRAIGGKPREVQAMKGTATFSRLSDEMFKPRGGEAGLFKPRYN